MRKKLDFLKQVQDGMAGKNAGLHNCFDKFNDHLYNTQRGTYYAVGGMPGAGKSAFTDDNFILSPYTYYKALGTPLNVKWFYYSFEISEAAKRAKWTAYKLYNDLRINVDPSMILSRGKNRCDTTLYNQVAAVNDFMEELFYDHIHFVQDVTNPTGILNEVEGWLKQNGTVHTEEYTNSDGSKGFRKTGYTANGADPHVIIVVDHVALTKKERGFDTKENIDKLSEYMIYLRNLYNVTPVIVCQFNKGLSGVDRQKLAKVNNNDLAPILEDFKDTGNIGQDCNVALGLFNPAKYNIREYGGDRDAGYPGWDITQMPHSFRSVHIMKNRDGQEYFVKGMHFLGGIGRLRELPVPDMFEAGVVDYKNYQ